MDGNYFSSKLLEILTHRFDLEKLNGNELPNHFLELQRYNIVHALANEELKLTEDELDIAVYRIIRNEVSEEYFSPEKSDFTSYGNETGEDLLLVCVEKKTGYFYTNCSKLSLGLRLDVRISEEDRQNKTLQYYEYEGARENIQRRYKGG